MSNLCDKCHLNTDDNTNEILLKQIRTELRKLQKDTDARLLLQDGKIAELCCYLKENLDGSIRELLDNMEATGELETIIRSILDTDLTNKIGFVTLQDMGGIDNGIADNTSIIKTMVGRYPVIDLLGKSYVISDTIELKDTILQNGTLVYRGKPDKNIIHMLQDSGLRGITIIVDTPCSIYSGNIVLIDYTGIDEQWVTNDFIIENLVINCTKLQEFYEGSTAIRITYDKYKVITSQLIHDVKLFGRIDYGIYIEPLLRDTKDNPVYNTSIFRDVFFYSANCALKVCPKMAAGALEDAMGGVGLHLEGFSNQHIDGITKPFMDLHNTNIEGDLVIPWDYYGAAIPAAGMYKLHNSFLYHGKNYMTVAADDDSVSFAYKRLSTGEVYSNIHATKPKVVEDNAPVRGTGIAWGVDNIKSVVFKPSKDNQYGLEYIGFEMQRNNKSVAKNKAVQFGVSPSGTLVWRQYTEGEGWGDIHQIYSQGKIPQSYAGKRPDGLAIGDMKFDTSVKVPVWWNGENWIKADGTVVSS